MKYGVSGDELDQGTAETDEFPTVMEGGKRKADALDAAKVDVWMSTKVVRDHYVLNWNISDIRNVASHDAIKSPLFRAGRHFQHIWEAEVTPTEIQGQMFLGVKVKLIAFQHWENQSAIDAGRQLKVALDVSIVDKQEKVCHGLHGTDYVDQGGTVGWPEFLKVDDLDSIVQKNGDLRLLIGITIEMDTHLQGQGHEVTEGQPPPAKKICTHDISNRVEGQEVNDLGKVNDPGTTVPAPEEDSPHFRAPDLRNYVWKNGDEKPDLKIRSCGSKYFFVHSSILAEKSRTFQKLFEEQGIPEGVDCQIGYPHILKIILDFMYTGKIAESVLTQNAEKIFEYSQRFGVPELQVLAEEVLLKSVCAENAVDLWHIKGKSDKLETKILAIFKQNPEKFEPFYQEMFMNELQRKDQEVDDHSDSCSSVNDDSSFDDDSSSVDEDDIPAPPSYETDNGFVWEHSDEEPDFEIITSEITKTSFKVHKSVLASKNAFFKKLFENGPAHQQDSIEFEPGHPPAVMKTILDFIYAGKIDEAAIRNNAAFMLYFGHDLEIPELKNLAEEFLADTISAEAETIFYLWWDAECHDGKKLMAKITEFVQLHPDEFCPEDLDWLRRKLNLDGADEFNDWPVFQDWTLGDEPPDYEIVTLKGKQKFLVHKSVLAQKSAFFKKNFENGSISHQKRDTRNVTPETLRAAIEFMYTGTIAGNFLESGHENVEELFELVDDWNWGIPELRNVAEEAMLNYICAETVFKWWFKWWREQAPKLKSKVCEYAQQHPDQFAIGCQKYFEDRRQQQYSPEVDGNQNDSNQTA